MAKRVGIDKWLFGSTLLLVVIGVLMVFSASAVMANERFGSAYYFLFRQLGWAVAGLTAMAMVMNVDYRRWKNPGIVFTFLGVTTLMLVAVFFLDRSHNTHRWIKLGVASFQPSELAKPALILFLAFFLESRVKSIDDWRHTLLPAFVPVALFAILIVKQPDLGTAIVCLADRGHPLRCRAAVEIFRLRAATDYSGHVLPFVSRSWRARRMTVFLDPWSDPGREPDFTLPSL